MVRILCLHGTGSNADIFEAQTAGLRSLLPPSWEWVFVDAETECGPLPGTETFHPGPYYTTVIIPSVGQMKHAYDWLLQVLDEEGPFDGFMGFSAGAQLGLVAQLAHQKWSPVEPPLFQFMIFICGNIPFSPDRSEGIEVTDHHSFRRLPSANLDEVKKFNEYAASHPEEAPHIRDTTLIHPALRCLMHTWADIPYDREHFYSRSLHPGVVKSRVQIPTLHIVGKEDEVYEGSKCMADLCDVRTRQMYEQRAGHDVTKDRVDLSRIKDLVEKTVLRSQQLG